MLAKLGFFFFSFFVDGVLGCLPDTGKVSTSPSFSFDVQPPLRWSFGDAAVTETEPAFPGQPRSKEDAQANFKDDLELAVLRALNAEGIPAAYASSLSTGTNPVAGAINFPIDDDPALCKKEDFGVLSSNHKTIVGLCIGPPAIEQKYSVKGTIGVKTTIGLSESTWESLAVNVQTELTKSGAIFVSPITVKV